jgi:hypothetical protein
MTMEQNILDAIELLKQGKTGKVSNVIFTVENAVVYRAIKEDYHGFNGLKNVQEIIAIKTNSGTILGNSSRMIALEDKRLKTRIEPARIQRILSDHITMIPFSVFTEAGLDLLTCEIVDQWEAETLKEKNINAWRAEDKPTIDRHYTGARLFKASPKHVDDQPIMNKAVKQDKYFLCDVDRREVEHNIINFFLAELPEKCDTIKEAYEMLKPSEVKMFEQNTGKEVLRQGEFFFIPTFVGDDKETNPIRQIRVGNSRPNTVEKGFQIGNTFYVTGKISHTGREHADLELDKKRWFKVVPNTSKANFQLTGDID